MYKILIIFENNLNVSNNGEINSLKNFLKYIPSNFNITITNIGNTTFHTKQLNIISINKITKINLFRKLFLSLTFNGANKNTELIMTVIDLLKRTKYDHIIFFSNMTDRYFSDWKFTNNITSLIMTDLPSKAFRNYIENTKNIFKKSFYIKELLWSNIYEKKAINRYKNIIMVNKNEVIYANRKYKTNIFKHIPVVFDYPNLISDQKKYIENELINLVFLGNMSFRPNIDGVNYFYHSIFKKLPNYYRLHLIGKEGNNFFKEDKSVVTYGFVEDLSGIMSKMNLGICFMVNGGGMKNKVFDYMKYGVPCIVNSYVCENNAVDSSYIYKADNMDEFLAVVKENMNYDANIVRESIAEYAVENVAKRFWSLFGQQEKI